MSVPVFTNTTISLGFCSTGQAYHLPSVLWRCWLGGRKGIRPVKNWVVGCWHGCVWSEVQICIWPSWCHCHSLSLASVKSRLVLPFWYRLTRVVLEKGPLNGCVCVWPSLPLQCSHLLKWTTLLYTGETFVSKQHQIMSCQWYPDHIFHDTDDVNLYFAEICRDWNYSVADVERWQSTVGRFYQSSDMVYRMYVVTDEVIRNVEIMQ